jgi:hypothetical protein
MIQRSYSLPSCTLLVEGISTGGEVLSIVTSFGFRFHHHPEPIIGGIDLLKSMVKVVGAYAQALKSNSTVTIPDAQVSLVPEGQHFHLLSVMQNQSDANNPKQMQVKLDTVQLFDLMESLDRLCTDPTTLPDLQIITTITEYKSSSQLSNSALPAILGVFSLAIATTVLYFVPIPKQEPKPVQPIPQTTQPLPQQSAPPTPPSPDTPPTPETSPSPTDPATTLEPTTSPTAEPTPESTVPPDSSN